MMTVSITPDHQAAAIFSSAFLAFFTLISGFFIPKPRIPKWWWIWYYYICPVAWAVSGLIVTQYGDIEDRIKKAEGMKEDPSIKWHAENHFGYDMNFKGPTAAMLIVFSAFFALVSVCRLHQKTQFPQQIEQIFLLPPTLCEIYQIESNRKCYILFGFGFGLGLGLECPFRVG